MQLLQDVITYFSTNAGSYLMALGEHILISLVSVAAAFAVGVPLGILASRSRAGSSLITGTFSTLRIIPSLALLFLFIPFLGVGHVPAIIALSFLAIPPILINTTLAFSSLPAATLEAAAAMGMKSFQIFFLVKIPLSMPLILAGVKMAAVEVISSATLAAYIGAGGLGVLIMIGLSAMRMNYLIIGGVTVAALSLLSGALIGRLEHYILRYRRTSQ